MVSCLKKEIINEEMQESNEWMKIEKSRNDVTKNAKSCGRMKKTYEN